MLLETLHKAILVLVHQRVVCLSSGSSSLSNIALINWTVKEIYSLTLHQSLLHLAHNLNVADTALTLLADLSINDIFRLYDGLHAC